MVIDTVEFISIVNSTLKLILNVFYGILVGRNRRSWQDVDVDAVE